MLTTKKDQYLDQVFDIVARTVDGQGRGIDLGIMGVVLYLNIHGIRTTCSCEGHLDHGACHPWVWVDKASSSLLTSLIEAFYADVLPSNRVLVVEQLFDDTDQLLPSGSALQERRAPDERARVLKEYQRETLRFAEFLRDLFFAE